MKNRILAVATFAAILTATAAQASEFKPYIGMDISGVRVDYESVNGISGDELFADSAVAVNPYIGVDLHKNFAVELGYFQTGSEKKNVSGILLGGQPLESTEMRVKGFHIDAVGKHAVNDKLNLLGSLGIARIQADTKATVAGVTESFDDNDTVWRLGFGADYKLHENWSLRGMVRYMNVEDGLMQYGVGVSYRF